jgi:GNAT superfamily N-acetyltransferase
MQIPLEALDGAEQRAWADLVAAAPAAARRRLALSCEWRGPALVLASPVADGPLFNRAVSVPADPDLVAAIVAHYRERGVGRFLLQPALSTSRAVAPVLEAQGLVRYRRAWGKLVRRAAPPPPPPPPGGLVVRRARPAEADACGRLVADAFDLPPAAAAVLAAVVGRPRWHVYAAFEDLASEIPLAVGALFVDGQIGEVGALAFAATAPAARGRGAQPALIARRVEAAAALGCAWVASETGLPIADEPNPSYRNFLRAGFVVAHRRENYAPPGTIFGPPAVAAAALPA